MTDRSLLRGLAAVLLITVASQVFYITVVSGSANEALRPLTWFTELFAFTASAVFALALATRRPSQGVIWATIAIAGLVNIIQVGMGLSMFGPAMEASDAVPQLFAAVLAGAFFFYFLAKLLLGVAAILLGLHAVLSSGTLAKGAGGIAVLAGASSVILALLAMVDAESWRFAAGAAGTAATAFVGLLLFLAPPVHDA
ncbi:hypothetical protein K3152_05310 [Qipengyuania sp. 1NDH17]|uniref:Thiamine biosynthesis protein ThiC n=1 Tax=Qipengyuania polymorpha TaxID=2867234 RepID=A0ABS7J2H0_9SPHN|nr:hypothetical protein [Qipengyuania polymorpha]MBX7457658.1 hypothetical protein [Qipengyuania polymorpha]